jgi:pSer/pThr/pTyr-binding forkhead associated (FHA) protein
VQLSAETGREHRIHELDRELTVVGRTQGEVVLPRDSTLSSRHASLEVRAEGCFLKDLGSTNGSFVAVTGTQALAPGAVMLVGAQRLLYRSSGGGKGMELVQVLPRGRDGRSRPLDSEGLTIGKENADFLFPEDEFMSKQHAVVVRTADGHAVRDLGSTNGTYLILRGERELEDGDRLALGDTVFEYRRIVTR